MTSARCSRAGADRRPLSEGEPGDAAMSAGGRRGICACACSFSARMARTRVVRVVVRWRAGPTWASGPPSEQPGWDEHASFVDDLVANGTMVLGGPFADNSGSLTVLQHIGEDEARE